MTDRAVVRLAQIAHEYDLAGKPREADIIEQAMLRLADGSAVQNWWNGVKNVGSGIAQDAKAAGEVVAAPFEAAGSAAKAAWNGGGLAYAPQAASQAAGQAWDRAKGYTAQELHDYAQAAPGLAGPGGTGLAGAAIQDAVHGVGQTANSAVQGYFNNAVSAQEQVKQQQNMASWLQQAVTAHKANGTGWQVIHNASQYGQLSPQNQAKLRQEFAQAATQFAPGQH